MKKLFGMLAMCLFVGACVPSTPQSRIAENPQTFGRLSEKHKALVEQGRIDRGMTKEGVLLAWGNPASRYEGYENRRHTERWSYSGSKPVMTTSFYGGYDYFGYGYGRRFYPGYRFAVGPEITYVPYTRASVTFNGNRVESWESIR